MKERIPHSPPVIAPVTDNEHRPLWSVMIPTYNCINYLKETLECVLLQDPGPELMQIEVVDDKSTDGDVAELVYSLGKGRVGFYQQPENCGSLRNFETCLNRARGKWIHLLHGDDRIKNGFYNEIKFLFDKFSEAGAAFTKYTHIDENGNELEPAKAYILQEPGIIDNFLLKISQAQQLQPPAIVVKRSVYEQLGGFFGVFYGEDWEMWIRIAASYKMAYSPKCLALYRTGHTSNITSRSLLTGQNIKDIIKVINIVQDYLPHDKRREIKRRAMRNFAIHYAMASNDIYEFEKNAAFVQAKAALKMDLNPKSLYWVIKLYLTHLKSLVGFSHSK